MSNNIPNNYENNIQKPQRKQLIIEECPCNTNIYIMITVILTFIIFLIFYFVHKVDTLFQKSNTNTNTNTNQ